LRFAVFQIHIPNSAFRIWQGQLFFGGCGLDPDLHILYSGGLTQQPFTYLSGVFFHDTFVLKMLDFQISLLLFWKEPTKGERG